MKPTLEQRLRRIEEKVSQKKSLKESASETINSFEKSLKNLLFEFRKDLIRDQDLLRGTVEEAMRSVFIRVWNSEISNPRNEIDN